MEQVACNLCGSSAYSVMFEAGVAQVNRIVKCNRCSLIYANPLQHGADVKEIKEYDANWVYEHIATLGRWRIEKESLQVADYEGTRQFLADQFPRRGVLVEIGCGLGYILNSFKADGWTAIGIEPNAGLCLSAQRDLGLNAIAGTLEDAAIESNHADVATMFHVIEHVPDPMGTFSEVHRILKPGGIFVVETPRYDTLMFKMLGRRERSVSCDGHIFFFTTATLGAMARKAGFEIVKTEFVGRSMTGERLLHNLGIMTKSRAVGQGLAKVSAALSLNKFKLSLNVGDMQRAYLRKPG